MQANFLDIDAECSERAAGFATVRIVGISGSSNPSSSNRAFLEALAAVSPEEFTIWSRLGELPHFSPELDGNDAVASLRSSVADADVVVIAREWVAQVVGYQGGSVVVSQSIAAPTATDPTVIAETHARIRGA
ncbi:MAG: NAD(P)H-dependent oxidoreductase [Acidimicrobiia bacterium]